MMGLTSLIALAKQFGAKLDGQASLKWSASDNGINIEMTDAKNEWIATFSIGKTPKKF